jgi:long-chain acyl-CoA synthetase
MNNQKVYPSIDRPWEKYYSEEAIRAELPQDSAYMCIYNNNQDNLDRVAIDYYGTKNSYKNFFDNVDSIASSLQNIGIKQGDIVTVCMLNSPETVYLIYALNKLGAIVNSICGMDSDKELIEHISGTDSSVLFVLDMFVERICKIIEHTKLNRIVVTNLTQSMSPLTKFAARTFKKMKPGKLPEDSRFISWEEFLSNKSAGKINTANNADAEAIICYTGGSKGVVLSNKNITAVAQQYILRGPEVSRESTWLQVLPLFIAYGVTCSLQIPLMVGMTIIMRIVGSESLSEMCRLKPQYIIYGPAFWEQLADENKDLDLSFLIEAISGGDMLQKPVEEKINKYLLEHGCHSHVLNGYGMTEVGAAVSVNYEGAYEFGSVGIPFVKTIVSVFDVDTEDELPVETEGEICISGPSIMVKYYNNPVETEKIIHKHDDGRKWVHSGDLGYISKDGFIHVSGRLKRYMLTKYNGIYRKVFSLDIERCLIQFPEINRCAVVPMPDSEKNQVPRAFVILKQGVKLTDNLKNDIKIYCESNLEEIYQPQEFVFVDSFPLTKIGKVDYNKLEKS